MITPSTTALATAVRQLPAVAALQEVWQQRKGEGETDADYWAFHDWLDRGINRGAPPPAQARLAATYEWSERALAYERASALQLAANGGTAEPEAVVIDHLTAMVQMEVAKLMKASATSSAPTASLKDLLATVNLIAELRVKAISAASSKVDMSKLTTEEIGIVLKAQEILRRTGGRS